MAMEEKAMSGGLRRSSSAPLMNRRPPQELLDGLRRFSMMHSLNIRQSRSCLVSEIWSSTIVPHLRITRLNAPIPCGAGFGYHPGGWGKSPVYEIPAWTSSAPPDSDEQKYDQPKAKDSNMLIMCLCVLAKDSKSLVLVTVPFDGILFDKGTIKRSGICSITATVDVADSALLVCISSDALAMSILSRRHPERETRRETDNGAFETPEAARLECSQPHAPEELVSKLRVVVELAFVSDTFAMLNKDVLRSLKMLCVNRNPEVQRLALFAIENLAFCLENRCILVTSESFRELLMRLTTFYDAFFKYPAKPKLTDNSRGKLGIEKQPFQLTDFTATGIEKIIHGHIEKETKATRVYVGEMDFVYQERKGGWRYVDTGQVLIESVCSVDGVEALSTLLPMLPEMQYFQFNPVLFNRSIFPFIRSDLQGTTIAFLLLMGLVGAMHVQNLCSITATADLCRYCVVSPRTVSPALFHVHPALFRPDTSDLTQFEYSAGCLPIRSERILVAARIAFNLFVDISRSWKDCLHWSLNGKL
ncbi:patatin family protein [Corchorus capsularis]|uniref:Patatin family protein n=1 Tax=Corchorus capsularis TaxID=210143 RepID=A0A1R3GRU2_COCAP|nr:patatin family protein [Corchorus capsularis]